MRDSATHQMAYLCVNYRSSVAKNSGEGWFISINTSPKGENSPSARLCAQSMPTNGTSFALFPDDFATTCGEL